MHILNLIASSTRIQHAWTQYDLVLDISDGVFIETASAALDFCGLNEPGLSVEFYVPRKGFQK